MRIGVWTIVCVINSIVTHSVGLGCRNRSEVIIANNLIRQIVEMHNSEYSYMLEKTALKEIIADESLLCFSIQIRRASMFETI